MNKKILKAQERIEMIKEELLTIGAMRPGKLSPQKRKNKNGEHYGSYWQLSYTHEGKSHSRYVPDQFLKQVESQTAEYKKFRGLTEEWIRHSIVINQFLLDEAKKKD